MTSVKDYHLKKYYHMIHYLADYENERISITTISR
ncbi:MAG: hypothetical protein ACJAR8_001651 [Bacteroidia bacterium]|jgi:hypothetical protein